MTIQPGAKGGGGKGQPGAIAYAWGAGSNGQLGQPIGASGTTMLRSINSPATVKFDNLSDSVVRVASGNSHVQALTDGGLPEVCAVYLDAVGQHAAAVVQHQLQERLRQGVGGQAPAGLVGVLAGDVQGGPQHRVVQGDSAGPSLLDVHGPEGAANDDVDAVSLDA